MQVGSSYSESSVVLDGETYAQCGFRNCTLMYGGTQPFKLNDCVFIDCQFRFTGAAWYTIQALNELQGARGISETFLRDVGLRIPQSKQPALSALHEAELGAGAVSGVVAAAAATAAAVTSAKANKTAEKHDAEIEALKAELAQLRSAQASVKGRPRRKK